MRLHKNDAGRPHQSATSRSARLPRTGFIDVLCCVLVWGGEREREIERERERERQMFSSMHSSEVLAFSSGHVFQVWVIAAHATIKIAIR
jgi:hypothetical protein